MRREDARLSVGNAGEEGVLRESALPNQKGRRYASLLIVYSLHQLPQPATGSMQSYQMTRKTIVMLRVFVSVSV